MAPSRPPNSWGQKPPPSGDDDNRTKAARMGFAEFVATDGRSIFVRRDAVVAVYDSGIVDGVQTSVVHTPSTAMPVPYTAESAMEVLFG